MKWHIFIMTVLMVCNHSVSAQSDKVDMRVILLGTSGPEMSPDRSGYATLIEVGGKKLLFDAGRGVLQRLYESEVDIKKVTTVFLTHLHNDHIEGLASL